MWGRRIAAIVVACVSGVALGSMPVQAAVGDEKVETRVITGDVVWAGKQAISIESARTENTSEEMLLPLDKTTTIDGPKRLTELTRGDHVSVSYRQTYREKQDGTSGLVKTTATRITLQIGRAHV